MPADTHDLDNAGATTEKIPLDVDGYPRLMDNPNVDDTGHGAAPIVGMGACEEQSGASAPGSGPVYLPLIVKNN